MLSQSASHWGGQIDTLMCLTTTAAAAAAAAALSSQPGCAGRARAVSW
jgi:hypothetical protein